MPTVGLMPAKGGDTISPRTKLALVAIAAAIAIIVAVVGLASLAPKTKPASVNERPVAEFTYAANNLTVVFNASASHDPDGSIANYSWNFGDEAGFYGKDVTHTYSANGTYKNKLTVTDNGGAKNSTSMDVTVTRTVTPATNKQPVAVIEIVSIDDLTVSMSGANSKALQDKTITSYAWTFGDDKVGTGVSVSHTYTANGAYMITLTVTDSAGATNSASVQVKVSTTPAEDEPPTAVISIVSVTNLTVKLSGVDSMSAPGATIVSYAWNFGDGTTETGVIATHTYAKNGTYSIALTVTDSSGLSDKASVKVTVSSTPMPPPPNPHPQGPPGLLHAIEIHKEKADRNGGLQNSLDHLEENLGRWLQISGLAP
jgi:PKD repeat protein